MQEVFLDLPGGHLVGEDHVRVYPGILLPDPYDHVEPELDVRQQADLLGARGKFCAEQPL